MFSKKLTKSKSSGKASIELNNSKVFIQNARFGSILFSIQLSKDGITLFFSLVNSAGYREICSFAFEISFRIFSSFV